MILAPGQDHFSLAMGMLRMAAAAEVFSKLDAELMEAVGRFNSAARGRPERRFVSMDMRN